MKYLFGLCLIFALAGLAVAQQEKTTPSIQPTAEALMKAQANNDKAQKQQEASTEELKKFVEREIAKSAALPVATSVQDPITLTIKNQALTTANNMVVIDGVVYLSVGSIIRPMIGSGCFLTQEEINAKTQSAQAKFAEMNKAKK